MTFHASCITVMIASPSDVVRERAIARDVAYEWNAIHSRSRGQVLLPVGWESHAVPAMGERPQAIINKQVLKDSDILVAIFWTRLGSFTGKAPSGTVEEIEEHIATGKPVLIYFSKTPVALDSVDSTQYAALQDFRTSLQSRGLYEEFDSPTDFQAKFARHLSQTINEHYHARNDQYDDIAVEENQGRAIGLSPEAARLLKAASVDPSGRIMVSRHMGGTAVGTNGVSFSEEGNARSEALWEGAVSELENEMLIEDRGFKREVFAVTSRGYRLADDLPG